MGFNLPQAELSGKGECQEVELAPGDGAWYSLAALKSHAGGGVAVAGGHGVLFVGTKKQAQDTIQEEAKRAGQFFVTNRWLGGTLTNFRTVKGSIERLRQIEKMAEDGTFERMSKKEVLHIERERE